MRERSTMHHTRLIVALASVSLLMGGALAACSSSSSSDDAANQNDASTDGTANDATSDSALRDSGPDTYVAPGSCPATTLAGTCDLVLQNCGSGKECDPIQNSDGTITAQCETAGTGSVPLGHECCQNAANNGDCVAGLFCNAACANPDAGPGTKSGRCAPYCCAGDNTICGSSDPEGIKGLCNVTAQFTLGDGGTVNAGNECTYDTACKPFHVQDCADPSATCIIGDDLASFKCSEILTPPGVGANGACTSGNSCMDGYECLGALDGGSSMSCLTMCFIEAGAPPFNPATSLDGGPTHGGCPVGSTCGGGIQSVIGGVLTSGPPWYGICQ
jgi:hypothetical protein